MSYAKKWLNWFWNFIKNRDASDWSIFLTSLLVISTFILAIATHKMAEVMMLDFKNRNIPVFWTSTPKLNTTSESKIKLSLEIRNVSDGIAKNALHNVIIEKKTGDLFVADNIIAKSGNLARKLNEIPIEYVSKTKENIELDFPKKDHPTEQINSIVLVLTYDTLFDDKRQQYIAGYIYEISNNHFDPMAIEYLEQIVGKAKKTNIIK